VAETLSMTRICRTPECENRKFANARSAHLSLHKDLRQHSVAVRRCRNSELASWGLLEKQKNKLKPRALLVHTATITRRIR